MLVEALDGLGAGLFLVDATGRIVHANLSGHALLQERTILRTVAGTLVACEADAARALKESFAMAGDGAACGSRGTVIPLSTRDGGHYVACVLALASGGLRRTGARHAAVSAVFVHKARLEGSFAQDAIARLYKLTPSEARVLLAIVEVGGVPETAQALGLAEATVKTHLHRLFGKTGATRQADLVKLVASFSNPLLNPSSLPRPTERCHPARADTAMHALRLATGHHLNGAQSAEPPAQIAHRLPQERVAPPLVAQCPRGPVSANEREVITERQQLGLDGRDQRVMVTIRKVGASDRAAK
jgi:DNA-binding CsgD family transcriptional regulator